MGRITSCSAVPNKQHGLSSNVATTISYSHWHPADVTLRPLVVTPLRRPTF